MSKKASSASKKGYHSRYNYNTQRVKRLERLAKQQPNNDDVVVALKRAKTSGVTQMIRSNKKGGWINKDAFPWAWLSKDLQRLPCRDAEGGDVVSQFGLIMNSGHAVKKKFARQLSEMRHGVHQYTVQREKELALKAK